MIARSRYVKDDPNRAGHLLSTTNNRRVVEHRDLDRGCPGDLRQFLAFASALSAVHPRAKITLAHFKISPSTHLNRRQLLRALARIRRENRIGRNHPMRLIEHDKGDRPPHYHLLLSAVDPATGRVLSSKDNYARDELVSRRLEIEFGEVITPGPRVQRNAADLRARGRDREAEILEAFEPVRRRGQDTEADRQQASRTRLSLAEFRGRLLSAIEYGVRFGSIPHALATRGFLVGVGDHRETLMAVHGETGMALPLVGSVAIASDGRREIPAEAIERLLEGAPTLAQARREGAVRTLTQARRNRDRENDRGRFEAAIDGDFDNVFSRMQRARKHGEADGANSEIRKSQAALRREASATRREAARITQMRIDRAFKAARVVQSRRMRRIAFGIAVSGMLLTGAGLTLALGVGVAATVVLAGYGDARRSEAMSLIATRRQPRATVGDQARWMIDAASILNTPQEDRTPPKSSPLPAPQVEPRAAGFDFALIGKQQRVLAAMMLEAIAGKTIPIARDALERALGVEAVAGLDALGQFGSARQRRVVQSWNGERSSDAFAAEAALRRAGEGHAASVMARIGRQRAVTERNQGKGLG